ncbi:class F sortase [Rhodococcus erythropolis]|uniref:class F sortase n=1 Tax=Rhodococcus erythropolis TaxID=1833 RepID=UPI0033B09143
METGSAPQPRSASLVLAAAALLLLMAGGFLLVRGLQPAPVSAAPMPNETFALPAESVPDPVPSSTPMVSVDAGIAQHGPGPASTEPGQRPQIPTGPLPDNSVMIPAVGVQAELESLGLAPDASLLLPADVDKVTHWTGSAPMDASDGGILVAGHVDNADQGHGALYWMHTLHPGDAVYLTEAGVATRWKVIRMETFVKEKLPDWAFQSAGGPRELHLVTCGGPIVTDSAGRGSYLENVVVTAVPF